MLVLTSDARRIGCRANRASSQGMSHQLVHCYGDKLRSCVFRAFAVRFWSGVTDSIHLVRAHAPHILCVSHSRDTEQCESSAAREHPDPWAAPKPGELLSSPVKFVDCMTSVRICTTSDISCMLAFLPRGSFVPTALETIASRAVQLTRQFQGSRFNSKVRPQPLGASLAEHAGASGRGRKRTTVRKSKPTAALRWCAFTGLLGRGTQALERDASDSSPCLCLCTIIHAFVETERRARRCGREWSGRALRFVAPARRLPA
jgi:hypothetical protein